MYSGHLGGEEQREACGGRHPLRESRHQEEGGKKGEREGRDGERKGEQRWNENQEIKVMMRNNKREGGREREIIERYLVFLPGSWHGTTKSLGISLMMRVLGTSFVLIQYS